MPDLRAATILEITEGDARSLAAKLDSLDLTDAEEELLRSAGLDLSDAEAAILHRVFTRVAVDGFRLSEHGYGKGHLEAPGVEADRQLALIRRRQSIFEMLSRRVAATAGSLAMSRRSSPSLRLRTLVSSVAA